jgi:hypothetical protein
MGPSLGNATHGKVMVVANQELDVAVHSAQSQHTLTLPTHCSRRVRYQIHLARIARLHNTSRYYAPLRLLL